MPIRFPTVLAGIGCHLNPRIIQRVVQIACTESVIQAPRLQQLGGVGCRKSDGLTESGTVRRGCLCIRDGCINQRTDSYRIHSRGIVVPELSPTAIQRSEQMVVGGIQLHIPRKHHLRCEPPAERGIGGTLLRRSKRELGSDLYLPQIIL